MWYSKNNEKWNLFPLRISWMENSFYWSSQCTTECSLQSIAQTFDEDKAGFIIIDALCLFYDPCVQSFVPCDINSKKVISASFTLACIIIAFIWWQFYNNLINNCFMSEMNKINIFSYIYYQMEERIVMSMMMILIMLWWIF